MNNIIDSPKGDKSLAVNLLKKTYEKQKCERLTKADGDIDINHKGLAPICGAESNVSMGSAQSLPNFKSNEYTYIIHYVTLFPLKSVNHSSSIVHDTIKNDIHTSYLFIRQRC